MPRRPMMLLAMAGGSAALAVLVWVAAFGVGAGGRLDDAILRGLVTAASPRLEPRIDGVAAMADPLPFVVAALALCLVALARGRPWMALAVAAVLAGANVTTQILKPALADQRVSEVLGSRFGPALDYPASWPSGHSTAAMSLALCAVLIAGPRWRPLAATLGAAYAVGVGYALVSLGWHLPSDVLGGYLVATAFTLLGAAGLAAAEARWAPGTAAAADRLSPRAKALSAFAPVGAAVGGLAAVGLAAIAALSGAADPSRLLSDHGAALLAGSGIAALGIALTAVVAVALRRS